MKAFLNACKKRPLVLWILLFCCIAISVALCVILLRAYASPMTFVSFIFLYLPIIQLFLYRKSLIVYEVVQIIFSNLAFATIICWYMCLEFPWWIFWVAAIIDLLIAGLVFALEIGMLKKKYRDGSLEEYLERIGARTYIHRK